MKTVTDNRYDWLLFLLEKFGTLAALNVALGRQRNDATLSQIKNRWASPRTGAPRVMGTAIARSIEALLDLERGLLDSPINRDIVIAVAPELPKEPKVHPEHRTGFGERLRAARSAKGLTQVQLGKLTGIAQATIAQAEVGRNCSSRWVTVLARVLEVDPYWLAEGVVASPEAVPANGLYVAFLNSRQQENSLVEAYRASLDGDNGQKFVSPFSEEPSCVEIFLLLDRLQIALNKFKPADRENIEKLVVMYLNAAEHDVKSGIKQSFRHFANPTPTPTPTPDSIEGENYENR